MHHGIASSKNEPCLSPCHISHVVQLHTAEHMNQVPEEAVVTAPLCMPEADPAPPTTEIESLKAQLEAANQRAHTYLRKVRQFSNLSGLLRQLQRALAST